MANNQNPAFLVHFFYKNKLYNNTEAEIGKKSQQIKGTLMQIWKSHYMFGFT